jgi:O-antigen/teichoic acid export membrane protein
MSTASNPPLSQVGSRRSLLRNSSHILVSRVLTTVVSLIAVPIVVNRLDVIGYGTWESIIAVSVLSNIFQGAINGTLLWRISAAYGADDMESVRQYVGVGIFFALLVFIAVTPLAWIGRDFLLQLFQVPEQFSGTASIVLPCVVGLMVLGCANEVMAAVIQGFQRSGTATLILASSMICNSLTVIACLLLGLGFWSLLIGFAVGFITYGVGLYTAAKRIFPSLSLVPLIPKRVLLRGTQAYAGFMLLGAVSVALRDQTDKIVLSSVASPVWTGYFGIAARLAGLMFMICSFVYVPTFAAAGALKARDDWAGVQRLYTDVMTVMALVVGLFVALIIGLHDRLLILWVGRPIPEVGIILYFLIAGNAVAVLFTGTGSSVCKGIGIIKIETIYILVGILLNLILKVTLVPWVGAIGTVASSAGSWILSSVLFIILLHKQIQLPVIGTVRALKALIVATICALSGRWLSTQIPLESSRLSALVSISELTIVITIIFITLMVIFRVLPISTLAWAAKIVRTRFVSPTSIKDLK